MSAKPTNEKLIEHLQATGRDTPDAADIIAELWSRNVKLVRFTVHRVTGLNACDAGFEDMEQQAFFGFHAAAYAYDASTGFKFSTYATRQIEWELFRYYERNGFAIRIPAYIKKRFRDCMRKKRELEAEKGCHVTYEVALKALGFSPAAIAGTLTAFHKLETVSLDNTNSDDGDGVSLLNMLADGTDVEEMALRQEWHRELHELLFKALQDIPEDTRAFIVRHYFSGISFARLAREKGVSTKTLYARQAAAFQSIRAGKYGPELAEFAPSMGRKERAERLIKLDRAALERLWLTDEEKGLLAL